jgi:Uma2 family endonuclease
MAVTKPAGTWTYEDLFSLPDDGRRYEIIEGTLYELPTPLMDHAITISNLVLLLIPVHQSLGGWMFLAPLDVFFAGADPVQPDIVFILPQSKVRLAQRGVEGPPDLLIEVLSPVNRSHDLLTKRALYVHGGVREYWIVDPESRSVDVLTLDGGVLGPAQRAAESNDIVSPLLDSSFPIASIFARIDEIGA